MSKTIGLLSLLISSITTQAYADNCYLLPYQAWRFIFSVGGGLAETSKLGSSAYFPITDPTTSEYYRYTASSNTDSSALLDLYLAGEFEIQTGLLLQLGLGYMQPNSFTAKGQFVQGADSLSENTYDYQYKILSRQLLIEAKLLVMGNDEQKFHPYLLVGGGVAHNNTYNYQTNVPATLAFTRQYASKIYNAPSFLVGGGVEFDIHEQVRLGFGYRYAGIGKTTLGNATIDGVAVSGTLYQSNVNMNEYVCQLTLRF